MTRRISDEDGFNAGYRNIGRLALATIPWMLGAGACVWFGFYLSVHGFLRELSQEERAAVVVGAEVRPKAKMQIDIEKYGCLAITRADLDGAELTLYAHNNCGSGELSYLEWHWALVSPNETVLHEGWTNRCAVPRRSGDSSECKFGGWLAYDSLPTDDRASKLRVWLH